MWLAFPTIIPRFIKNVSELFCVSDFGNLQSLNTLVVAQSWIQQMA